MRFWALWVLLSGAESEGVLAVTSPDPHSPRVWEVEIQLCREKLATLGWNSPVWFFVQGQWQTWAGGGGSKLHGPDLPHMALWKLRMGVTPGRDTALTF